MLQPLVVRPVGDQFQLIAGERRLRAAQAAGLREVPVTVVNFDDQQVFEASLVENIQRSDLNPIEKAQGFKDYLDRYGVTQEQLAGRLGMDRTSVSNLVNLLHLPDEVQTAVRQNQISLGHAKILKGLPEPAAADGAVQGGGDEGPVGQGPGADRQAAEGGGRGEGGGGGAQGRRTRRTRPPTSSRSRRNCASGSRPGSRSR